MPQLSQNEPRRNPITQFHLAIGAIVAVAAVAVLIASLRMTDQAIERALEQRDAAARFVASELAVLRSMAVTSRSPVPARLYLGIEECFQKNVAMPFGGEDLSAGRQTLTVCAEMELGRLHAQGGAAMADEGRGILKQTGLLR